MQRKEGVSRFWAPWDGPELPVPWSTVAVGKKNCTRRARREADEGILIGDREPKNSGLGGLLMSGDNGGSKVALFLAGMGLGAVVALLFAPRSGKETREYISNRAEEGRDYIRNKSDEGREFVSTQGRELRSQAEQAIDKAKDVVGKQKDQLSAAVEAGKQAYQVEKKKSQ